MCLLYQNWFFFTDKNKHLLFVLEYFEFIRIFLPLDMNSLGLTYVGYEFLLFCYNAYFHSRLNLQVFALKYYIQ